MIDLVDRLEHIRVERNMTHTKFAHKLRIDRSHWWRLRKGKVQPGPELVGVAIKTFPGVVSRKELGTFILAKEVACVRQEKTNDN